MATPLHSLFCIWQEINTAVQASIEQRSVFLCPVTTQQFNVKPISASIGTSRQVHFFLLFHYLKFLLSVFCHIR